MITRVKTLRQAMALSSNFEHDPSTTTGLQFGHFGGAVHNFGVLQTIAAGTVTVPNGVSIIFLDTFPKTATIEAAADPSAASNRYIPLYQINTSSGSITTITDLRSWTTASLGTELGLEPNPSFDSLVATWSPEFDYQFRGANAGAGLVNDGSETDSANTFPVIFSSGPNTYQVTNGDVANPGFCVNLFDGHDGYGHNGGTLYSPGTEWDMTSGSIVCIFRSDENSPDLEHFFNMTSQGGFGIKLSLEPAGHVEFFLKLSSNNGGELNIDSGGSRTVVSDDNTWHIAVITQDGGTVLNPLMYLDGVIEDDTGGSFDSNDDRGHWFKTVFDTLSSVRTAFGAAIGGANPGSSLTQGFGGDLDRLIFMTKELTAQEVSDMYDAYFNL